MNSMAFQKPPMCIDMMLQIVSLFYLSSFRVKVSICILFILLRQGNSSYPNYGSSLFVSIILSMNLIVVVLHKTNLQGEREARTMLNPCAKGDPPPQGNLSSLFLAIAIDLDGGRRTSAASPRKGMIETYLNRRKFD